MTRLLVRPIHSIRFLVENNLGVEAHIGRYDTRPGWADYVPFVDGVHLPYKGCNLAATDDTHRERSIRTLKQAMRVIKAYTRRWLIEEYHKCLKSGTRMERSQLTTAQHITALLGILAVVAVRLLKLKLLATTCPVPAGSVEELGPEGLVVLEAKVGRPPAGWTPQSVWFAVARLGGFLARRSDGNPGWLTLWRGWRKLMLLVQGVDLARGEECG